MVQEMLEKLGGPDANGKFRLYVMVVSTIAACGLGFLSFILSESYTRLDEVHTLAIVATAQNDAQDKRMDRVEGAVLTSQAAIMEALQRLARIEGVTSNLSGHQ